MTVTLKLNPEVEERALAQAATAGVTLEAYLQSVIEVATLPAIGERATLAEFEAAMDAMAEGTDEIPPLSPEAVSRESIYGDRG